MRDSHCRRFLSLLPILCFATPAFGGAWLEPKGQYLVIGQFSASRSTEVVQANGNRIPQPAYEQLVASLYAETGVTDWLTLGAAANGTAARQQDRHAMALTEPTLFARLPLWSQGSRRLSIEPVWQLPRQLRDFRGMSVGNAKSEYELALDYGEDRKVAGWDSFVDLRLGYRYRPGESGDQWRGQLALGTRPAPRWLGLFQAFATLRTDRGNGTGFTQSGADDYDQLRLQASAVWEWTPEWSLQAGAYTDVYGRNFGLADGVTVGVWRRF